MKLEKFKPQKETVHIHETSTNEVHTPKKLKFLSVVLKFIAIIIPFGIAVALIPYAIFTSGGILQKFFKASNFTVSGTTSAFSTIKKTPTLLKDASGHTNILIVGIDTRVKGSKLLNTDTIILASYNHTTHEVAMISFPRDLDVNYPNTPSIGKINATYAYGEKKREGSGMEYLKQLIESISGTSIQYHVMVDLKGFTTIIDQLEGVDVNVDTAFKGDYPTDYYGWITVKFPAGVQHMNGQTALQYARIRHAYPGSEASDFARARRQQKVIQAVIEKATQVETLQNVKKILEIMGTVADNIKINRITPEDIEAGLFILKDHGKPSTFSLVLDPSAGGRYGTLIKRGAGYLYTLEPTAGRTNWTKIKAFIQEYFREPTLVTMTSTVYVYNNGAKDFSKTYSAIANRFYFATFKNGGTPTGLPKAGVYNVGGAAYKNASLYLASQYKLEYIDATDPSIAVPRPKDTSIVIVLQ